MNNARGGQGLSEESVQHFSDVDLRRDPGAATFVKHEIVRVRFAREDGAILSREGPNHYRAGDAIVTSSTGEHWSVSRERFGARYQALESTRQGTDGAYVNRPAPVLAKQIPGAFSVARSAGGDLLKGKAQDWLLQYAAGDYGIVENARFMRVYRPVDANSQT